jgi:photosystem II stability/assembly factor-like uncharacterized protein
MAVATDGTIYANVHVGWIVRSRDGGDSWESVTKGLEKDVHQVAVDADDTAVVIAATARGFHLSHDHGETFERRTDPMPYHYQRACQAMPGSGVYLCSTSRGPHGQADALLFRSTDRGAEWTPVTGLPTSLRANIDTFQVHAVDAETAFAITENTDLWRSDDAGRSWRPVAGDLPRVHGFLQEL